MAVKFAPLIRGLARLSFRAWLGIWLALLFFGALFWAKGRDPFQRIWFKVETPHFGKAECIAVLPKTAAKPMPVVLYLHNSGRTLLRSGNDLRQMAEMGLAAIGMEYNQTNETAFAEQFTAMQEHVSRQAWATTNQVAWVGLGLGAQRLAAWGASHPELKPQLLVCLAGVASNALAKWKPNPRHPAQNVPTVLLVRAEYDPSFSAIQEAGLAAVLAANGWSVKIRALPYEFQSAEPNRRVLFRGVGEFALELFRGPEAFRDYRSILHWQESATPLWRFWIPAALWVVAWWCGKRAPLPSLSPSDGERVAARPGEGKLKRWEIALRWLAGIMAALALGVTALHLVPPRLAITPGRLEFARKYLIAPKEPADFDYLSTNSFWTGKKLKTLLEHVELANYNRALVNWKLDDEMYRRFVLSPEIAPELDGTMHWRRWLWESFYPRIRKEDNLMAAAEIIVRHLRSRVTIAGKPLTQDAGRDAVERVPTRRNENSMEGGTIEQSSGAPLSLPKDIEHIWIRQITDKRGFEAVYVAALRSAGVPARLDTQGRAECWSGSTWKPAPRPVLETW